MILLTVLSVLPSHVAAAGITISAPQTISQGSQASYSVTVSPTNQWTGQIYEMSVSGVNGYFSPDSVGPCTVATCPATTLVVDASTPTFCPGTYSFSVTATSTITDLENPPGVPDTGVATGSVTVLQAGPPLQVTVSSDKTTYQIGDTVTISVTVTRPSEGTVTVSGPLGMTTYTFTTSSAGTGPVGSFTAKTIGTYSVSVTADDFCQGTSSNQATFQVTPNTYDATIMLSGVPAQYNATVQVDGQSQGTVQGSMPSTLTFPIGTRHTVTVGQYVTGASGVRYYCAQNSWSISATGSNTFTYQTQYQLTVSVSPSGVTQVLGGGWFNSGDSAQTSMAPQTVPGAAGVQYVFQNWAVDGGAQSGNQITVVMNGPHSAVANYKTQYLLTVNSPNGLGGPQGGGYYDSGSTAQFSVSSPVGYLIQQVFMQWQGDSTSTSPQASITMDAPKTVNATWTTSYTNLYLIGGGAVTVVIVIAAVLALRGRGKAVKKEEKEKKRGLHLGDSDSA